MTLIDDLTNDELPEQHVRLPPLDCLRRFAHAIVHHVIERNAFGEE
jgi:hypothetical protein